MKYLLTALLLVTATAQAQVTCDTDRFTGTSTCSTEVSELESNGEIWRANVMGLYSDNQYYIVLTFGSDTWQFLDTDKVYFLIGNDRETMQLGRIDSEVSGGRVIEQYGIMVTKQTLADISNSETEFKIGTHEFVMPISLRRELNQLINKSENI